MRETLLSLLKLVSYLVMSAPDAASNPRTAYHRAYSHVSGKCASYRDIMMGAETGGFQHLASTLVPNSIGEVAEVRDLPSACITRANRRVYVSISRQHTSSGLRYDQELSPPVS